MEESSALNLQLANRIRGVGAAETAPVSTERTSCSSTEEAAISDLEDDEAGMLRSYRADQVNLWRVHRQTVQLSLEHLDKVSQSQSSRGRGDTTADEATRAALALIAQSS